ncbi:M48 family metalloprotease [uncultured Chitinophaga sp.]|jgi:Peptidase family M48.|uniref:M48 family metalloprotease n=1 Tax=uncultured Chitinophaga sp. TaxID=339340 RepID=UPI002639DF86|nr:M48 family metalloprotease [uncultured Chitinophaga sp.]
MRTIFVLFISLLSLGSYAQVQLNINLSGTCSYYGESMTSSVYGFSSSQEAEQIIERIVSQVGLKKNFQINAANVPNAAAVINGSTRYILYSQSFIGQVNSMTNSRWASISILAHEIGHHLNGHTLESTGSRPSIELEADEFSGFVLAKMGASLAEAQLAMNTIASENSVSGTHPVKSARLEAIAVGWYKAREGSAGGGSGAGRPPAIPANPGNTVTYVSKCLLTGDANAYYVTDTNLILRYNASNGQMAVVGQKQGSADSRFAWIFASSNVMYGVDRQGNIWWQNAYGQFVKIGIVTYP